MAKRPKRSDYSPPRRSSDDVPMDRPGLRPEVTISDQQREAVLDGLDRTSGTKARYMAGADALGVMEGLLEERERLENVLLETVQRARSSGVTWAEIGETLGVSQQAASKKYGPLVTGVTVVRSVAIGKKSGVDSGNNR